MRKTNLKKYLVLGIIGLFFTVSIAPNITGDINWINKSKKPSINDNDNEPTYSTTSQIYYPGMDTYILQHSPDANRGTSLMLRVSNKYGAYPTYEADSLIWFDLSDIPSGAIISTVTLNIYYFEYWDTNPVGRDISCYSITNDWDEYTTTFNNKPSYSSTVTSYGTIPSTFGWVSWDVTDDVRDFVNGIKTNYGWWIMDENYWGKVNIPQQLYHSREGTYSPYLDFENESNNPPIANANGPYIGFKNDNIQFDGSGSYDPNGIIISYLWEFGDGHTSTEINPGHRYSYAGTYSVKLTVEDNDGLIDTDTTIAEISLIDSPTVIIIYPTSSEILKDTINIEWYAHDSGTAGNLPIYIFLSDDYGRTWTPFPDNPYENTGELSWDTTRYADGDYKLLVEAVDNDGNIGHDRCSFEIKNNEDPIENNPPNKPSKPSGLANGKAGEEYTYESSTTDTDGDQVFYKWDFGNDADSGWLGPYESGETCGASHVWEFEDNYNIRVKARDTHGDESPWSDPLSVTMPKYKLYINSLIELLMERFPILYQLLQRILQL